MAQAAAAHGGTRANATIPQIGVQKRFTDLHPCNIQELPGSRNKGAYHPFLGYGKTEAFTPSG
jgi:hypothetical protein